MVGCSARADLDVAAEPRRAGSGSQREMPLREQHVPTRRFTAMASELNLLEQRPRTVNAVAEAHRELGSIGLQDQRLQCRI